MKSEEDIADICIFACTGVHGRGVAREICQEATTRSRQPLKLLLAGRNLSKVREVRDDLLLELQQEQQQADETRKDAVSIQVYPKPVDVSDDLSVQAMAARARVVANCIDIRAHPRALVGVAEACSRAGTHYLDIATAFKYVAPLLRVSPDRSLVIPQCGVDFALYDFAIFQAEQSFLQRYGEVPCKLEFTLALRPGEMGIKWPIQGIEARLRSSSKTKTSPRRAKTDDSAQLPRQSPQKFLKYCSQLASWSIPWFLANICVESILDRRGSTLQHRDVRLALPRSLLRTLFYAMYYIPLLLLLVPVGILIHYSKNDMLINLFLRCLPALSLGLITDNRDLAAQWMEKGMEFELVLLLKSEKQVPQQVLCYRASGKTGSFLNQLCMALASLELASIDELKVGEGGVQTPAQAMGETGFWPRLRRIGEIGVEISEL
jgi:short subunit dehydrogenase-like uncharacterized protein